MTTTNKHDFDIAENLPDDSEQPVYAQKYVPEDDDEAQPEEDIDYEQDDDAIFDDDYFMDEDDVEHTGIREFIEQLDVMRPDDTLYDAAARNEPVRNHFEDEVFPQDKISRIDTVTLGKKLSRRKIAMMAELALPDDEEGIGILSSSKPKRKSRTVHGGTGS